MKNTGTRFSNGFPQGHRDTPIPTLHLVGRLGRFRLFCRRHRSYAGNESRACPVTVRFSSGASTGPGGGPRPCSPPGSRTDRRGTIAPVRASSPSHDRAGPHFRTNVWSVWRDSNPRPPVPKTGALTRLRYTPLPAGRSGWGRILYQESGPVVNPTHGRTFCLRRATLSVTFGYPHGYAGGRRNPVPRRAN